MSAVQTIPFPVQRQSAADLLASAAKSAKPGRLTCANEFAVQNAQHWLRLDHQIKELSREQDMTRDALIDAVRPFHEEQCTRRRSYESSVYVDGVRVSFQHRWSKIRADQEPGLREVFNGQYDQLFKRAVTVKLRKEITEDAEALDAVVLELANALGAERFAALFEVEQGIAPTKIFTESQYNHDQTVRAKLGLAGVRQVVAVGKAGG